MPASDFETFSCRKVVFVLVATMKFYTLFILSFSLFDVYCNQMLMIPEDVMSFIMRCNRITRSHSQDSDDQPANNEDFARSNLPGVDFEKLRTSLLSVVASDEMVSEIITQVEENLMYESNLNARNVPGCTNIQIEVPPQKVTGLSEQLQAVVQQNNYQLLEQINTLFAFKFNRIFDEFATMVANQTMEITNKLGAIEQQNKDILEQISSLSNLTQLRDAVNARNELVLEPEEKLEEIPELSDLFPVIENKPSFESIPGAEVDFGLKPLIELESTTTQNSESNSNQMNLKPQSEIDENIEEVPNPEPEEELVSKTETLPNPDSYPVESQLIPEVNPEPNVAEITLLTKEEVPAPEIKEPETPADDSKIFKPTLRRRILRPRPIRPQEVFDIPEDVEEEQEEEEEEAPVENENRPTVKFRRLNRSRLQELQEKRRAMLQQFRTG